MFNKILIIGAHFDDTELAAAGSACKWVSQGKKVYKLTLTNNVTNFKQRNIIVEFNKSLEDSNKAAKTLGMETIDFEYEQCNHLSYSAEVMQKIEKIIFDYEIDTVLIHSPNDANQDHIAAYQLSSTAARHCKNILLFNINGYITRVGFAPNFFVDVSDYIDLKIKALECYGAEHNRFGSLFETCIDRNKVWGYSARCKYAEAFEVVKLSE